MTRAATLRDLIQHAETILFVNDIFTDHRRHFAVEDLASLHATRCADLAALATVRALLPEVVKAMREKKRFIVPVTTWYLDHPDENMQEWASDIEVQKETVRAVRDFLAVSLDHRKLGHGAKPNAIEDIKKFLGWPEWRVEECIGLLRAEEADEIRPEDTAGLAPLGRRRSA